MGLTASLLLQINPPIPSWEESTIQSFRDGQSQSPWLAGASPKEGEVKQSQALRILGAGMAPVSPRFRWATFNLQKVFSRKR